MLKEEIIRLYESAVSTSKLAELNGCSKTTIHKIILKYCESLPKCQICGKNVMSINNQHLASHNISLKEYKEKYGSDSIKSKCWNKGLTKENSDKVRQYSYRLK